MTGLWKIRAIIKEFVPYYILEKRRKYIFEQICIKYPKLKDIRNYFLGLNRDDQSLEIIEIIDYLEDYKIFYIPYEFISRYFSKKLNNIKYFYDIHCKMHFILHKNKKMYFPEDWNIDNIIANYKMLSGEQDAASPHRYETKEYTVQEGDVIADIGAAEGIWALTYAEKAAKIYLFECENKWIKALEKTFEPWKEKVVIVNKYISDKDDDRNVTLDTFFKDEKINFIKADIEGAEVELLKGAKSILSRTINLSLILCAYHKNKDAQILKDILEYNGFITEYSNRYMLNYFDKEIEKPYIRRGVIRGRKNMKSPSCLIAINDNAEKSKFIG